MSKELEKQIFKEIAGNCHSDEATQDAVDRIMKLIKPSPAEVASAKEWLAKKGIHPSEPIYWDLAMISITLEELLIDFSKQDNHTRIEHAKSANRELMDEVVKKDKIIEKVKELTIKLTPRLEQVKYHFEIAKILSQQEPSEVKEEKAEETFSKFRLYNQVTGKLVYSLMINDNESANYFEDKKHLKKQEMSDKHNALYHEMYWEDVR